METKEFLTKFLSHKVVEVPGGLWEGLPGVLSSTYHGVSWEERGEVAESLLKEGFGCNFINNRCIAERANWWKTTVWNSGLGSKNPEVSYCCASCYLTVGNLHILPNDIKDLDSIASIFDPVSMGFWDNGCLLPPKFRSTECLTYRCGYLKKNFPAEKELLTKIYQLTMLSNRRL